MDAHVERPVRLADGKTYCACGRPWPCPHAAPADILAGIRDRNIDAWAEGGTSDIPLLLTAVELALKRHKPITRRPGWNLTCSYDNRRWPCPEVQDITAALTGTGEEGGSDG